MIWLSLLSASQAERPDRHCATMQLLKDLPAERLTPVEGVLGIPTKSLNERDVMCGSACGGTKKSEHFILRWGGGISASQADTVLEHFEYGWQQMVGGWDYPQPAGTDQYYFNVYIGDSGPGTPESYGAAGYFYVDQENMPYIVISSYTLDDMDYAKTTIVHEFYHSIQGVTNRYGYDTYSSGSWFWEATANWIEGQAFPHDPYLGVFLAGYTFFPHFPVNYFNYPDEGILEEYHQYGAFIFPQHISEHGPGADIIRSAWLDTDVDSSDPMDVMDVYLQDRGTSIYEQWVEHIGYLVTMEYEDGQMFQQWLDSYSGYPEAQNQIAVRAQGLTNGWVSGPESLEPYHLGHNRIEFRDLEGPTSFGVEFSTGSMGSEPNVGAILVRSSSSLLTYTELEVEGSTAELTIQDARPGELFTLVVGVWADEWQENKVYDETFSYRFQASEGELIDEEGNIDPEEDPDLSTDTPPVRTTTFYGSEGDDCSGCSSMTVNSKSWWGLFVGLLSLCIFRRRQV